MKQKGIKKREMKKVRKIIYQVGTKIKKRYKKGHETKTATRFSLRMEDEWADAGKDGRTRLASLNQFSGANGGTEILFFPV